MLSITLLGFVKNEIQRSKLDDLMGFMKLFTVPSSVPPSNWKGAQRRGTMWKVFMGRRRVGQES